MGVRKNFSRGGQRRNFGDPFQVADDAMHMDVHKTLCPFYTTKKMSRVAVAGPKIPLQWPSNAFFHIA